MLGLLKPMTLFRSWWVRVYRLPRLCKTGLGLLAIIPKLCHKPNWSRIHYGYEHSPFNLFSRKPTDMLILVLCISQFNCVSIPAFELGLELDSAGESNPQIILYSQSSRAIFIAL